jgi:hypothetical protein
MINDLRYTNTRDFVHTQLVSSEYEGFFCIHCRGSEFLEVCLNTSLHQDKMVPRRDEKGASYN